MLSNVARAALDECERVQPGFAAKRREWKPYSNTGTGQRRPATSGVMPLGEDFFPNETGRGTRRQKPNRKKRRTTGSCGKLLGKRLPRATLTEKVRLGRTLTSCAGTTPGLQVARAGATIGMPARMIWPGIPRWRVPTGTAVETVINTRWPRPSAANTMR